MARMIDTVSFFLSFFLLLLLYRLFLLPTGLSRTRSIFSSLFLLSCFSLFLLKKKKISFKCPERARSPDLANHVSNILALAGFFVFLL